MEHCHCHCLRRIDLPHPPPPPPPPLPLTKREHAWPPRIDGVVTTLVFRPLDRGGRMALIDPCSIECTPIGILVVGCRDKNSLYTVNPGTGEVLARPNRETSASVKASASLGWITDAAIIDCERCVYVCDGSSRIACIALLCHQRCSPAHPFQLVRRQRQNSQSARFHSAFARHRSATQPLRTTTTAQRIHSSHHSQRAFHQTNGVWWL